MGYLWAPETLDVDNGYFYIWACPNEGVFLESGILFVGVFIAEPSLSNVFVRSDFQLGGIAGYFIS